MSEWMDRWMGRWINEWMSMLRTVQEWSQETFICSYIWNMFCPVFLGCGQCVDLVSIIVLIWLLCPPTWSIDNLKSRPAVPDQSPCLLPGFRVLNDFLAYHVLIPEVYLIVSSFFLQTPFTELADGPRVCSGCMPGEERHSSLSYSLSLWLFSKILYPSAPSNRNYVWPASFPHTLLPG